MYIDKINLNTGKIQLWIILFQSDMEGATTMNNNMYLTKITAASLLGDASVHIPKDGSKNAIFSLAQTIDHSDYIFHIATILESVTRVKFWENQPSMPNAKRQLHLQTMRHPFYTKFRERMYGTGIKSVDPHYLTLLDWEFLAHWFMEDGSLSTSPQKKDGRWYNRKEAYLHTNGFSYGDNMLLKQALKEKLAIESNIRIYPGKTGNRTYFLSIYKKSIDKMIEGITKYIVPSFEYKITIRTINPVVTGDDIVSSV